MSPNFYLSAYSFDQTVWDLGISQGLADVAVDQKIHRHRGYYLESDIRRLWAQWFIEGALDPYALIEKFGTPVLMDIMREVERSLESTFNIPTNISWPNIRSSISEALLKRIEQIISMQKRKPFTPKDKELLLTQAGQTPRCWICGDAFSKEAISIFNGDSTEIKTPYYIDILRPKGLKERHLKIEIDHVFPVARGGEHDITNFRLCCGWCNIHKKDRTTLYEVNGAPLRLKPGAITKNTTIRTIPRSFWAVRAMGLLQRCEHEGCTATASNASLLISLIEPSGAATPSNLRVVCSEHDTYSTSRLHLARDVEFALP
ncbi:HNH endonuclease [Pseudomonas aeruginosa]|uniref:HNH endonuclease n=2 Tax=Pseudomonas aeruginosa TaxID=287 RepID=UPI001F4CE9FB|nr:HNH endonuclease [Pseudomonas aeruginosa]UTQ28936.1 HNH endonuclease [Pseudomonas aeruginosa]